MSKKKTVGIIGGMGPLATVDLFSKIVTMTKAATDQEHLHILIDNNPAIPDRTAAILRHGASPLPELIASAERLRKAGADFLIMPCNTAHYFYDDLCKAVPIPALNMIEETAKTLKEQGIGCVGLLATDGTMQSGVYKNVLDQYGIDSIVPDADDQREIMHITYDGVKAGDYSLDAGAFKAACEKLLSRGAKTLVLGCTELPLAFDLFRVDLPHVDPTSILAAAAVRFAGAQCAETV